MAVEKQEAAEIAQAKVIAIVLESGMVRSQPPCWSEDHHTAFDLSAGVLELMLIGVQLSFSGPEDLCMPMACHRAGAWQGVPLLELTATLPLDLVRIDLGSNARLPAWLCCSMMSKALTAGCAADLPLDLHRDRPGHPA